MYSILLSAGVWMMSACAADITPLPDTAPAAEGSPIVADTIRKAPQADTTVTVNIDGKAVFQTIEGFASSDAWNMDYVGRYWSATVKENIARLLFSCDDNNGQPTGIGLSMWRVNIGGGSAEQGDASGIDMPERRAECFLNSDGTYDWTKAAGQQYFMQKAKEYGVDRFVLFSNTPPVYYTRNGKGYSSSGSSSNLKADCYGPFADFLATVAGHFSSEGYAISHISPVNEPQYNWASGQEGSGWKNAEVARLVRELDGSLTEMGLDDTKIMVGEAAAWNYLYDSGDDFSRGNAINNFFNPSAQNYIGGLPHVPDMICAHSYWLDTSWNELQTTRKKAADAAAARGIGLYQTEWCMMSDRYDGVSSYDDASPIDMALAMAQVIHADLAVAGVRSWSYWTTCERERWGQKSRFYLIRLIPSGGDYGELTAGGTYRASKNMWMLGQYSRFIRPGYKRVNATVPDADNTLLASAYVSPDDTKLVLVLTNLGSKTVKMNCKITFGDRKAAAAQQYVTSSLRNMKHVDDDEVALVQPRSVATIVYDMETETSGIRPVYK